MNLLKFVALVATITLAACGSREWRANQGNKTPDVNTKANQSHPYYNSQEPAALELLKVIGGASLSVVQTSDTTESSPSLDVKTVEYAKVQIVLKNSCEHFVQELLPMDTGVSNGVEAEVVRSSLENEQEGHGWFESHCIGKDNSCDQVAVLFRHTHEGKRAETVITFSKNSQGKYSVNPVQSGGVLLLEADAFLASPEGQCAASVPAKQEDPEQQQPVLNDK